MTTAEQALDRLREGNERFVSRRAFRAGDEYEPAAVAADQSPFAVILGCSDSRVPAEIVFDQGLGDLFVVRVAGNIAAPSQIGSVEFAASRFGTRLVVVLGHSNCGAVIATLGELREPSETLSPNLAAIVDRVRPAIETLPADVRTADATALAPAVRANIDHAVAQLRLGSEILQGLQDDGLMIIGAEYALETGAVTFFDGDA